MSRAPLQILAIPFHRKQDDSLEYAIFKRSIGEFWQFISGGGEDDEKPIETARREGFEEAQIPPESNYSYLDTLNTIPVVGITGKFTWGEDVFVVPEHTFSVEIHDPNLTISDEHTEYRWVDYDTAVKMLKWDSNRNALWELRERLRRG
ncbi:MAG: NUDIX pyrophosphatase [Calditrichaeota bacterium]|nr:NUDIX pyrophosphatase [Calditrichota bacterium]